MFQKKILVVDDDGLIREMLRDILESEGYGVEVAEDGQVALNVFNSIPDIQLILADLNMPIMDGMSLIERIRDSGSECPVIVLSGNREISVAMQAITRGANDYHVKDEHIQETILLAIEKVLEKKRIVDENRLLMANVQRMNLELESIVTKMTEIGTALSAEKDYSRLLELILTHARTITKADAGILYLLENEMLRYKIVQNQSMGINMGGGKKPISFSPVPLEGPNVLSHVVLNGMMVNIPDVYENGPFDCSSPKEFDAATGYRSTSMLLVPMKNQENDVVGVLQLLNAADAVSKKVISFSGEAESFAESIASQAAVAITNAKLLQDMENLFEAFVEVMATAIDEKSPVTGNHIRRVANMTLELAAVMNERDSGMFADVVFDDERMHVLRIASLMHDIGKVTTPVQIIEKSKKLETIFDRVQLVDLRFRYISKLMTIEGYKNKLELVGKNAPEADILTLDGEIAGRIAELNDIREFVMSCNEPKEFLEGEKVQRLLSLKNKFYLEEDGSRHPYLTENELENLSVRKGSITEEERKIMQDHASLTLNMLNKIPFTRRLKYVPTFAGAHHEHINGKGYPLGLRGAEIPLEGRMMAVTDIAEALTASDRPYKKSMPLDNVYQILRLMANDDQLDRNIVELFIQENVYERYARRYEQKS